jgi:hypothetical protein
MPGCIVTLTNFKFMVQAAAPGRRARAGRPALALAAAWDLVSSVAPRRPGRGRVRHRFKSDGASATPGATPRSQTRALALVVQWHSRDATD